MSHAHCSLVGQLPRDRGIISEFKMTNTQKSSTRVCLLTHYFLNFAEQVANEKREFEDNLMDMIDKGDFEEIEQNLTPQAFRKCESNFLQIGMKVRTSCNFYCLITKLIPLSWE